MDFTREPIIESVMTPKEGCKLVVRSSKCPGQEEYFVDALEIVSFGHSLFFRSLERPKSFIVPACDYEVLEVREARMVLKNVGIEKSIKIGGGKQQKEVEKAEPQPVVSAEIQSTVAPENGANGEAKTEARSERRRDRRRNSRRRRGADGEAESQEGKTEGETKAPASEEGELAALPVTSYPGTLLAPPTTLISETIAKYRDNDLFKGAFYTKEEAAAQAQSEQTEDNQEEPMIHSEKLFEGFDIHNVSLEPSEFGSFGSIEEEEVIKGDAEPFETPLDTENHFGQEPHP